MTAACGTRAAACLTGYRKETRRVKRKGLRILAAAAVLTFGCLTMNAYAAEGWALSNNIWTYLDKNGNRVTNEWKRARTTSGDI